MIILLNDASKAKAARALAIALTTAKLHTYQNSKKLYFLDNVGDSEELTALREASTNSEMSVAVTSCSLFINCAIIVEVTNPNFDSSLKKHFRER